MPACLLACPARSPLAPARPPARPLGPQAPPPLLPAPPACRSYYYNATYFSMTDEWGNKWALQTSQMNSTTLAEWEANLDSVVYPPVGGQWAGGRVGGCAPDGAPHGVIPGPAASAGQQVGASQASRGGGSGAAQRS